jgi:hypothetical protein
MRLTFPYKDCIYCREQQKSCIFHLNKKASANEFWQDIRRLKPRRYDGFIFPNFESYEFLDDKKTLNKDSNFWSYNEIPIYGEPLVFINCVFENIIFSKTTFLKEIRFINCKMKKLSFYHCNFADEHSIIFENNIAESFSFDACNLVNIDQKYGLEFDLNNVKEININGCLFNSKCKIKNQKDLNIDINSKNEISLFILQDCQINKFNIYESHITNLFLDNCRIENFHHVLSEAVNIYLRYAEISKFILKSTVDNTRIENSSVEKEFIYGSLKNDAKLHISHFTIGKECTFTVEGTNFSDLRMRYFYRFSEQVFFSDLYIHEVLEIRNSNLSKVQFNSLTFDNNCHVNIYESNVGDSIFNNVEWNNISLINADRDTFRQLKNANDKQSNFLTAHQFYAREMEEYSKTVINKNFEEKIVFLLGKYISNFSQSWVMPFCWTIIVGIVMYLITVSPTESLWISSALIIPMLFIFFPKNEIYSYSFSNYLYVVTALFLIGFVFFSSNFNGLASFINPFGNFLKENPQHHYFIWLLHKIISSFTIYHFVIALRRSTQR